MTTSSSKKIGRPVGSKNKSKRGRPAKTFKQFNTSKSTSKSSKSIPLGAVSWIDAYEKTYVNLTRAYERLVKLQDVQEKLDERLVELQDVQDKLGQAKKKIVGLSAIINYIELRLDRKENERSSV